VQSLGEAIDEMYRIRTERLALNSEVEDLKQEEKRLEEYIQGLLETSGLQGGKGHYATAASYEEVKPDKSVNWSEYFGYAIDQYITEGDESLFYHQVTQKAWKERLDSGILVPGTEIEVVKKLSLNKAGKK
jgi:hypothetical protein